VKRLCLWVWTGSMRFETFAWTATRCDVRAVTGTRLARGIVRSANRRLPGLMGSR
jgi:hypothetical protein